MTDKDLYKLAAKLTLSGKAPQCDVAELYPKVVEGRLLWVCPAHKGSTFAGDVYYGEQAVYETFLPSEAAASEVTVKQLATGYYMVEKKVRNL
jgi:hypothetical protein